MGQIVLEMEGISKSFGATRALNGVKLTVRSHEIHALMGENGAGKSTLMKVLSGVYQPDAGIIKVDGKPLSITRPAEARAAGEIIEDDGDGLAGALGCGDGVEPTGGSQAVSRTPAMRPSSATTRRAVRAGAIRSPPSNRGC